MADIFLTVDEAQVFWYISPFLDYLRSLQTPEFFDGLESSGSLNLEIESFLTAYTSLVQVSSPLLSSPFPNHNSSCSQQN